MSLRGKLLLAQVPLVAALAAVGGLAAHSVSRLGRSPRAILQDNYRSVLAAERMKEAAAHVHAAATSGRSDRAVVEVSSGFALDRGQFEAELGAEEGNVTEPGEGDAVRRLRGAWDSYEALLEKRLVEPRQGSEVELESAYRSVDQAANQIVSINQEAMIRKSAEATEDARRAVRVTSVTALLAFLFGSLITAWMIRRVLRPVWLLTRTIAQLGEGDFDVRAAVFGNDELARLTAGVNAMAERLQEYRQSSIGKLMLAEQASQAAIDSIPDSVIVFDTKGEVLIANAAARALVWPNRADSKDLRLESVDPLARMVLERVRDHVLSANEAYVPGGFDEAFRLATSSSAERSFLARATAVRGDGRVAGATVVFQDVTSLRLAYDLRSDLVATVAHELRTPLTSLRIATHMCLEEAAGPINDRQADLLQTARDACERLQGMVDQMLDLARIQGNRVILRREAVSAGSLVEEAVLAQEAFAGERQISLRAVVLPGVADAFVDRERVQLVFSNLLTNAIRHSPPRSSVSVVAQSGAGNGFLRFEVRDEGGGIPPHLQGILFDRFQQGPGGPSGALGLGLSIAKDVVEAHGGEIGVVSTEGHGSTFWFTLPTAAREGDALAERADTR
jgi:signal transduction histidine kinase